MGIFCVTNIRQTQPKNVLSADLLANSTLLEICLRQPGCHIS
jgi:hypothetical protein